MDLCYTLIEIEPILIFKHELYFIFDLQVSSSVFNYPSISNNFFINFLVIKLESRIWQHEVFLKGYFSLYGFYKANYSKVSDCFRMLDVTYICCMHLFNPMN